MGIHSARCMMLTPVLQFQVTQKYLEHLISQRQYAETAQACAKLLKVSIASIGLLQLSSVWATRSALLSFGWAARSALLPLKPSCKLPLVEYSE